MESVYNFMKVTLLGLIVGILIILLLQVNYWANDIRKTVRKSAVFQNKEYKQELLEKYQSRPPAYKMPNILKHKI
jgi:hypothetical protein